jgi:hypothetical protein
LIRWPAFTAAVTFELFEDKSSDQRSYLSRTLSSVIAPKPPSNYCKRCFAPPPWNSWHSLH